MCFSSGLLDGRATRKGPLIAPCPPGEIFEKSQKPKNLNFKLFSARARRRDSAPYGAAHLNIPPLAHLNGKIEVRRGTGKSV
jgi:hypothetical protein